MRGEMLIRRSLTVFFAVLMVLALVPGVYALDEALAKKLGDVLAKGPAEGHWQVKADDVNSWIQSKKTDFLVVDVRPNPQEYKNGHIPGAIAIPYQDILKPENLKKLPTNKKIILVCVTGQTQNLPIVALRALGFDARTMSFGHAAWIKGYIGAHLMESAIKNAEIKNFPLVK